MSTSGPETMAAIGTHECAMRLLTPFLADRARIADLAAGQGAFSRMLAAAGHDVVPVDANAAEWKLPELPLRLADLDSEFGEKMRSEFGPFDAVAAIEIIEHLENPFRFVRECGKILRPGGILLLTSPNVESVLSRLLFLYTGRLYQFAEYETVKPAHITPIFKWKLDMMLSEAGFETAAEAFNPIVHLSDANFRIRAAGLAARIVAPFVKGAKGAEGRIVAARLK